MTEPQHNSIEGDNPIATLLHDQKNQVTKTRYGCNVKWFRLNTTEAIRTSEFEMPKHELNKDTLRR